MNASKQYGRRRPDIHGYPPGHYYSTIPSLRDVRLNEASIFDRTPRQVSGVDLNLDTQLETFESLTQFYGQQPFADKPSDRTRYFFHNGFYGYSDAIFLFCMLRLLRPNRVIEIGSGYSSFVMLDTNELFLGNAMRLTFVDPDHKRLRLRLRDGDLEQVEVASYLIQDFPISRFDELCRRDILFVDSSHVSKVGSDVNRIFFEILPRLKPGVFVHFHDMFYPFEYPQEWIEAGRFWNEDYIMRAFLAFNAAYKIVVWNHFLATAYPEKLAESMPLCLRDTGASLWIQRQ